MHVCAGLPEVHVCVSGKVWKNCIFFLKLFSNSLGFLIKAMYIVLDSANVVKLNDLMKFLYHQNQKKFPGQRLAHIILLVIVQV